MDNKALAQAKDNRFFEPNIKLKMEEIDQQYESIRKRHNIEKTKKQGQILRAQRPKMVYSPPSSLATPDVRYPSSLLKNR